MSVSFTQVPGQSEWCIEVRRYGVGYGWTTENSWLDSWQGQGIFLQRVQLVSGAQSAACWVTVARSRWDTVAGARS